MWNFKRQYAIRNTYASRNPLGKLMKYTRLPSSSSNVIYRW